nr:MAG TPA: neurotoxin [Caudoviricetes sp.]
MEKYNIYQESIAASQERITALFQKFVSNLDLSDVIKDVLEFAELLMKIVSSDALEWVLKLSPAILAVAYALRQVSKAASPLARPGLISIFTSSTAATILGVVAAATALYWIFKKLYKSTDDFRDSVSGLENEIASAESDVSKYKDELSTINERIVELNRLKSTKGLSITEEDELRNLQLQNKELELQIMLLEQEIELKRKKQEQDAIGLFRSLSQYKNIQMTGSLTEVSADQVLKDYADEIRELQDQIIDPNTSAEDQAKLQNRLDRLQEKALELAQDLSTVNSVLGEADEYGVAAGNALEYYYGVIKSVEERINEVFSKEVYQEAIDELTELAATGELTAATLNNDKYSGLMDELSKVGLSVDDVIAKFTQMAEEAGIAANDMNQVSYFDMVNQLQDKIGVVGDALKELNETGYLTQEVVQSLEDAGYELADSLTLTENGYVINREALLALLEAKRAEYQATMKESLQAAAELVGAKIDEKDSYDAVTNSILAKMEAQLAEARATAMQYSHAQWGAFRDKDMETFYSNQTKWKEQVEYVNQLREAHEDLKTSIANMDAYDTAVDYIINQKTKGSSKSGGSGGGSSSSSTADVESAFEREIRILEHRQFLAEQWAGVYKDNADTELQYQQKINEQIEIYGQLMARVHEEADNYRKQGYDDESETIQDLQKQYWEYYNARKDLIDDLADYQKEKEEEEREAVEDALDKLKDAINDLIDEAEDRLDKLLDYYDYQIKKLESMRDLTKSYYDSINEVAELQHEIDVDLATSKSKYAYLDETLRKTLFNEDDYNKLSSKLQGIAADCDALYSNYLSQLSSLTEDEIYKADIITDEYERQYNYKLMEYQVANAELNLIRAQANLQEVLANRNVRMYQNGQWTWVADHDAVADAEEQLEEAKYDYRQAQIELRQQSVIDNYDQMIASLEMQKGAQEAEFEALREQWEEIEKQLTTEASAMDQILEVINTNNLPQLSEIINKTGDSLLSLVNKLSGMVGGGSIGGSKGSSGGGGGYSFGGGGGGGGGGDSQRDFMEDVGSDPDNYKDGSSGYIPSYNPSVDYSQVYNDLKEQGASQKVLDKIEDYRDQKVEDVYGGKDPNPDWKKSYDTGGVLNGLGGIKATEKDEVVFEPDIASKLLSPTKSREFLNSAEALTKIMDNSSGLSRIMSTLSGIVSHSQTSYTDSHNIVLNGDIVSKISNEDFNSISSVLKRYIPVMKGV